MVYKCLHFDIFPLRGMVSEFVIAEYTNYIKLNKYISRGSYWSNKIFLRTIAFEKLVYRLILFFVIVK